MKTIKVIDLLNKIANGEKPTIKEGINKYEYNEIENDYITGMGYNYEHYFSNISNILNYLNDEIEIIEDTPKEDKKIEKLNCKYTSDVSKLKVVNKVDEIIELLNNSGLLSEKEVGKFLDKVNGE